MPAKYALSVDIGGTTTKMAVVSDQGEISCLQTIPTDGSQGVQAFIDAALDCAQAVLNEANRQEKQTDGIGIAVAGFVDDRFTTMTFNQNIPWLVGYPLTTAFQERFGYRTALEIDSNAAALGEYRFGTGAGAHRFMVFTLGTGVGGGMVVEGELLRISNQCLGDIGHVIVDPGGPVCTAGCKGCVEALISGPGLERLVASWAAGYPASTLQTVLEKTGRAAPREIIAAAHQADPLAVDALRQIGIYLGAFLASITPVFAPDRIAIAGGISEAGEYLLKPAEETYRFLCGSPYHENTRLVKASLGWQATLAGAACLLI